MSVVVNGIITALDWWVFLDTPASGSILSVAGVEFRSGGGTTNIATNSALVSCSSNGTGAALAIDGNAGTFFDIADVSGWIKYSFATAQAITSVKVIARNDANYLRAPKNISVLVTDPENSKVVWVGGVAGLGWGVAGANNVVPVKTAQGALPDLRVFSKKWVDQNRL